MDDGGRLRTWTTGSTGPAETSRGHGARRSGGHDRVVLAGPFVRNRYGQPLPARPSRARGRDGSPRRPLPGAVAGRRPAAQRARRSAAQQARLDELGAIASCTDAEETEYLTLSWFTDHADRTRAWDWALASARTQRSVNYVMNSQLNAAKNRPARIARERAARMPCGASGHASTARSSSSRRGARAVAGSTGPVRRGAPSRSGEADVQLTAHTGDTPGGT
jgi:hypothetical protein